MAPGLNGRQTGTVPKNNSKNSGSQSHRLPRDFFVASSSMDWEPTTDVGNKNHIRKKSSTAHSETEADSIRYSLERSRSSTMTSQVDNEEENVGNKINLPDKKEVVSKLNQIQSYVQQTTALMNALKASDSPGKEARYEKLSVMLEDLKESETKLSELLKKMNCTETRIDSLLEEMEECKANKSPEVDEEELARRSEESKKKLETLQKRKQDLLKLQEKAKKQLQEAQAEQSRLVKRASSLNQELNANKIMDLNVQQLSQRLKSVQQMYNTRNEINGGLTVSQRSNRDEVERPDEDQLELSDAETDFQLVADKIGELNAMKAQLGQIQKIMASINGIQNNVEETCSPRESGDDLKEHTKSTSQNSSSIDTEQDGEDGNNNLMKLEQAKTKLNQLTQLLEIVQTAQNTTGLSPSYFQLVSDLVNEEAGSSSPSPSPVEPAKVPQRNGEEISVETMQVMTRELEQTTAAMKEERDRLLAARQELQDIARKIPANKVETESLSPDDYSESEPPCLKPAAVSSSMREVLNGSVITEANQSLIGNEDNSYLRGAPAGRNRNRALWNSSLQGSHSTLQERRSKNESLSRGSTQSFRGGSRVSGRDQARWSPSPSGSYCNDRSNPVVQTQNQLEMSSNLCEMMLSESLHRGTRPGDISLQEMFCQHQLLTRTVSQCSQLLWLQQKQITELRNAFTLQFGVMPNVQNQQMTLNQSQLNVALPDNPLYPGFSNGSSLPIIPLVQQQQNFNPVSQNVKLNANDTQNSILPHQDFSEHILPQGNQSSLHFPGHDIFGCDMHSGNFARYNPSNLNANQNVNQNTSCGSNNSRVANGINCVGVEDSRALNNQVPPGNRANNYWDNFRSYSRQNLLSTTKSNEGSDSLRRSSAVACQERTQREVPPPHNNQFGIGATQQPVVNGGHLDSATDQYLLPPSQNTRLNQHSQITRSRSVEPQHHRNPWKNETRHQDNTSVKNESFGGIRTRNSESGSENIRSVRNDVGQSLRNLDNLNNSRNFIQFVRDFDNEEVPQGNNKKRLERTRCRNDSVGILNNRGQQNSGLWENISLEVSNFIRANDIRPHFLLQLFRDLQQVTTDGLRQRTLESIQETLNANNLTERSSNMNGVNVNLLDNRNNIRESRSNLNRNQSEDPSRIDELFYHLRENQNTIRQNIGMGSLMLGGNNLENPNISNIRDLGNPRNNIESEGLRDLRTYFEANLCHFGHNSTLENPNLSNIRENLTRRGHSASDVENVHPKNVYLSIYDNAAVEMRRRNLESSEPDFGYSFTNHDFVLNDSPGNNPSSRVTNNQFEIGSNFEGGAIGGREHFQQGNRSAEPRLPILDAGDNFGRPKQYLGNGNDSGIDINFNNEERKRGFVEEDSSVGVSGSKAKTNEAVGDTEVAASLMLPQWERNRIRETSYDSSLGLPQNEVSPFIPFCSNSFFNCRTFQQSDNRDLAEADQSRNEEASRAESDSGFINAQVVEPEASFIGDQSLQLPTNNFASQNVPESERSFLDRQNCKSSDEPEGRGAVESEGSNSNFPSSASEPEGNFSRPNEVCDSLQKANASGECFHHFKTSPISNGTIPKTSLKNRNKVEEAIDKEGDPKKSSNKNSTNKYRDNSFAQGKFNGLGSDNYDNQTINSNSVPSVVDERHRTESRDSVYSGSSHLSLEGTAADKGNTSPEAESDWECGSGLDQIPTRLKKKGSSGKSEDSG